MKKLSSYLPLLAAALILWGCKDGNNPSPDECGIVTQEIPAGDSAVLFIPNAFSPNGDGLNDRLGVFARNITAINFTVLDSKRNVVFSTDQTGISWAAPGTDEMTIYHYRVQGTTAAGNPVARCGTVYAMSCVPFYISRADLIFGDQYDPAMPAGYIKGTTAETLPDCN
jgi:hypothetical protein